MQLLSVIASGLWPLSMCSVLQASWCNDYAIGRSLASQTGNYNSRLATRQISDSRASRSFHTSHRRGIGLFKAVYRPIKRNPALKSEVSERRAFFRVAFFGRRLAPRRTSRRNAHDQYQPLQPIRFLDLALVQAEPPAFEIGKHRLHAPWPSNALSQRVIITATAH
jgi:hypothetical protein